MKLALFELAQFILIFFTSYYTEAIDNANVIGLIFLFALSIIAYLQILYLIGLIKDTRKPTR